MGFADFARRASKLVVDHSPSLLTGLGVAGVVSTAYLAGRASFEAADLIRLKEADDEARGVVIDDPREVIKQRFELVWRLYIPSVTMGAASIVCIIGANRVGTRRAAGLAAAYSLTEKSYEEYRRKVIEKIGDKKEELVRSEIVQDRIDATWDDSIEVHGVQKGEVCYDKFSDRYVWNTEEGLRAAANDLNRIVLSQGYATLGDFYDLLNMPSPTYSYQIGWSSVGDLLDLRFSSVLTPSGKPVKAFEFNTQPVNNYQRFH